MAYWWINIIIAFSACLAASIITVHLFKKRGVTHWLITAIIMVLAVISSHFLFIPYFKTKTFAYQLKQGSFFSIIAEKYPQIFTTYIKAAQPLIDQQEYPQQLALTADKLAQHAFIKSLAKAPDNRINEYLTAKLDLYKQLLNQNPSLILGLEFPKKFSQIDISAINSDLFKPNLTRVNYAKAAIIADANLQPQTIPDAYEVDHLTNLIISRLNTKYGKVEVQRTFNQIISPAEDYSLDAKIIVNYYQQMLLLGPANVGKIMRFMAGSK